jgi:RHS repeat-associated protein
VTRGVHETELAHVVVFYDDQHNRRLLLDDAGAVVSRFVSGPRLGSELAQHHAGGWRYPVLDFQETPVLSTSATGDVFHRARYGSFGTPVQPEVPDARWHGMLPGPDGLLLAWARPYDPAVGRFLSEDPIDAPHLYAYALNNPHKLSDPTGLAAAVAEYSLAECKALQRALPGAFELHHVVSNWAIKAAYALHGKRFKPVFALLTIAEHAATNTWGSGGMSQINRQLELELLKQNQWDVIYKEQLRFLKGQLGRKGSLVVICK